MRQIFRDHPEACDNTLADRRALRGRVQHRARTTCRASRCPQGETEESWFVKEVEKGLHDRYPAGIPDEVRAQAEYETGVIAQMGFPGYFLVVADFINWAKRNGIRVGPGRGSGAGSMAAYAMGITDLDPLQHGLIFERFLNPDRVSMPDFDVDFDDRRRGEVIQYVTEKYGDERVAQIVTYGTIKAKQALKDAGRVLGFPFSMGERLTKAMPPAVMGKDMPLEGMFDRDHPRFKEASRVPRADRDGCRGQDGLRHRGGPREPEAPVGRARRRRHHVERAADRHHPDHEARAGRPDRHAVRLPGVRGARPHQDGLPGAAQPHDHQRRPRQHRGEPRRSRSCSKISRSTTRASYELLARGDTLGVFQLDGGPMRSLLRLMKPDNFEDISAVIALYRPGPMGANSHIELRAAQERAAGDHADPPRARGAARRHPRHQLRPDHLSGAGHGDRAEASPASRSARPTSCAARWARRRSPSSTSSTRASRRHDTRTATRDAAIKTLWDILRAVLGLRLQQGALRRVRPDRVLDRVPQGALSRPSTWPRCSRASATRRTSSRSTSTSAAAWASRCCRRTWASPSATSPPSAKTSASASARCATSARTSSTRSSRRARTRAFASLPRLPRRRCPCTSRTSARSSRSSRPAPSTRSAPPVAR